MKNVYDILEERGFIDQATYPEELKELLSKESVPFYIGFDATADSLTLGHFLQVRVMQHMQLAGHKPIALLGGGTTMIGDPSGKTDMRKIMTKETIEYNAGRFKEQLSHFLDFSDDKAIFVNNADWLLNLNFLDFMREIGVHFSVNRMLTFDCYKNRMEKGLTFFEFAYMLMQSYDFLVLYRKYGCKLELGGSDQWSNMLGGYELVRKLEDDKVYSMTFKLLTTAAGIKMGKTEKGAVWLDASKTSPYEMYQYMRNSDDRDVIKFMKLLTMLPMEEIAKYESLEGAELNTAKEVLAYEIVKDVHGEEEAKKAMDAAKSLFSGGINSENIPSTEISSSEFENGKNIVELLKELNLIKSNSEGRRLIEQNGITIDDEKVKTFDQMLSLSDFKDGKILIRKGKKVYHQVKLI
ncbi:tyrosine--tRNA ligase [Peptoniphilus sp. oral taxon 386]|uniref:tyrosine--tRNA ligase n=1 Tax=Peptoniphilus sp. oral taxon 386 TaxID=652713 RepID=UPI0001DA9B13|nr:tyrosine--tRNA ligase [Peptoniphilus sp. oral taxon 386]EFI42093.1 tyrosine--tRNA ligase [Peptoniphilus sp. oral taxon 386 str. F0131]